MTSKIFPLLNSDSWILDSSYVLRFTFYVSFFHLLCSTSSWHRRTLCAASAGHRDTIIVSGSETQFYGSRHHTNTFTLTAHESQAQIIECTVKTSPILMGQLSGEGRAEASEVVT
jgi:hypothetical protein